MRNHAFYHRFSINNNAKADAAEPLHVVVQLTNPFEPATHTRKRECLQLVTCLSFVQACAHMNRAKASHCFDDSRHTPLH
jgi:hypothetical protein